MDMYGAIVKEEKREVTLPPLSSTQCLQISMEEVLQNQKDLAKVFVVADMTVSGKLVSKNLLYLEPTKQIHLLPAKLQTTLTHQGDHYVLRLLAPVLARDVYITFGELDVKVSDNYFDLLPGESQEIVITSDATLSQLQEQLKVVSLVDAFAPDSATAKAEAK